MAQIDTYGIPEFFVSHVGAIEEAGPGLLRVIYCVARGTEQTPVHSNVMPASSVLQFCREAQDMAMKVMNGGSIKRDLQNSVGLN